MLLHELDEEVSGLVTLCIEIVIVVVHVRPTGVVTEEDQNIEQGTVAAECPNCGNNEATTYYLQTRSGDEGATQFYQCTKCSKKWRDYG